MRLTNRSIHNSARWCRRQLRRQRWQDYYRFRNRFPIFCWITDNVRFNQQEEELAPQQPVTLESYLKNRPALDCNNRSSRTQLEDTLSAFYGFTQSPHNTRDK